MFQKVIYGDEVGKEYSRTNVTEECTWESSNREIATVDKKGNVTGISKGYVNITAKYLGTDCDYKIKVVSQKNNKALFIGLSISFIAIIVAGWCLYIRKK